MRLLRIQAICEYTILRNLMIIVFFSVFLIAMLTLWLSTSLMYVANDHSSLNNSFSAAQGRDIFHVKASSPGLSPMDSVWRVLTWCVHLDIPRIAYINLACHKRLSCSLSSCSGLGGGGNINGLLLLCTTSLLSCERLCKVFAYQSLSPTSSTPS